MNKNRPLDICKIETCSFVKHKVTSESISANKAIQLASEELDIPASTIKKWIYPAGSEAYNEKRRKEKERCTTGGTTLPESLEKLDELENIIVERKKTIIEEYEENKKETRIAKNENRIQQNEALKRDVEPTEGLYDVIIIDPPWPVKKIEREVRPNQTQELDYPTMTIDEIHELNIPAAESCHLFLWTTHKFLPTALEIIERWGFRYVCCMTWHKPGGYQPVGLPQYNSEFCLYARKGTPKFIDTKNFNTCFNAKRGAHSEKPGEFYETIRRVTSGKCVDMFNRREIEGFDSWGFEAK